MKIAHEFTVPAGIERAWEVLTDLELIAPCLPGAQITGRDGDAFLGKLKVKVGPVVSEFGGAASFVEKDDANHRAVIEGKARDVRGAGNASAVITAVLTEEGERTRATVEADMKISGKLAQFGSGMIQEVSEKLIGTFVTCLEGKIGAPAATTSEDVPAAAPAQATTPAMDGAPSAEATPAPAGVVTESTSPAPAPVATAANATATPTVNPTANPTVNPAATVTAPAAAPAPAPQAEVEALDLGEYAGRAVAKRLVPVVVGVAVVAAVVIVIVATR